MIPSADPKSLRAIKLIHTIAWAFFAGCVVAIPVLAVTGELTAAAALIAVVLVEVLVLALNDWKCPLTPIAARYTSDRSPNFDIFLPRWLARYNKEIFGVLYLGGMVVTIVEWIVHR